MVKSHKHPLVNFKIQGYYPQWYGGKCILVFSWVGGRIEGWNCNWSPIYVWDNLFIQRKAIQYLLHKNSLFVQRWDGNCSDPVDGRVDKDGDKHIGCEYP